MAATKATLPQGCDIWVGYDSSIYVEKAISEVWETLGVAFLLVVLIIFVFLRNFRSTIIPSVAIPVSIVGTFAILYAFGYSINILTMLALVLSIGVVVDDAIVVLEAIYRHIEEGMTTDAGGFQSDGGNQLCRDRHDDLARGRLRAARVSEEHDRPAVY